MVDVRPVAEYARAHIPGDAAGHIEGALHLPLGGLSRRLAEIPRDRPLVVYCGHGERAASAISLLEARGFGPLLNLVGGIAAWRNGYTRSRRAEGPRCVARTLSGLWLGAA